MKDRPAPFHDADPLAALMHAEIHGDPGLPDAGFAARVLRALPAPHPRLQPRRGRWSYPAVLYLAGATAAGFACAMALTGALPMLQTPDWWHSPHAVATLLAPLGVLTWLALRLTDGPGQ